jgi:uncharacterized tellurite resistance protein B-like protein
VSIDNPSDSEEAYFHQRDLEQRAALRKKMDKAAQELKDKRGVARAAGTEDLDLAERIRRLGFTGETAMVFDLMPLVHTAWADGSVSRAERSTIFTVLHHRNIERGSEAFLAIESLLEEQPSDAFQSESMAALRDLMAEKDGAKTAELIELCAHVADASGGILGLARRVSEEERHLIAKIADSLGSTAQEEFRKSLHG